MVEFRSTMGGYEVRVDGNLFGHIDKDGFFTDSTVVTKFMRVSSKDLQEIADKADGYKKTEVSIRNKGFLGGDHDRQKFRPPMSARGPSSLGWGTEAGP